MTYGITENGFKRKTLRTIQEENEELARQLYGEDINLTERSPLGIFLRLISDRESKMWSLLEDIWNSRYSDTATGVSLDHNVKNVGIIRKLSTNAKGQVTIIGEAGTIIPKGFLVATPDNVQFSVINTVTLDNLGTATVDIKALESGTSGNVPANTITEIVNPTSGVDSVNNTLETKGGLNGESDNELRVRRDQSISKGGSSTVESVRAALLQLDTVSDAIVEENETNAEVNGIPAKSIAPLVVGGEQNEIIQAIFKSKAGGIQSFGSITQTVTDSMGNDHIIGFSRPIEIDVYVNVTITKGEGYPTDGDSQVKTKIIEYIGGTDADGTIYNGDEGLGDDITFTRLIGFIYKIQGIEDVALEMSTDGVNYSTSNIVVGDREVALTDHTKVVVV